MACRYQNNFQTFATVFEMACRSQNRHFFVAKSPLFAFTKAFLLDLEFRLNIIHVGFLRKFLSLTTNTMTKQDLVAGAAQAAGVTKKAAGEVLESVLGMVTKSLKKGETVTITGFGTFRVSHRAARTGVNPRNPSQKIKIPAMKLPAFKAGKSLKDAVR